MLIAVVAILAFWIGVLPRVGEISSVRAEIDQFHRDGIDPAALYYTELECLPRLLREVDQARADHPEAFWRFHSGTHP